MKKYLLLAFSLFSSNLYATDCKNAVNTQEINQCAKIDQEKTEAKLNATYQQAIKSLSNPDDEYTKYSEIKSSLILAQKAWIKFRKADCNTVYLQNKDGTIRTAMYISCMQERAEQRIKELNQFTKN